MAGERPPPSLMARAESDSRQLMMHLGLGIACFVVGSIMSVGVAARIAERFGAIENLTVAWVVSWAVRRTWLLVPLPAFGFVVGRLTSTAAFRFALTAGLAGDLFGVALAAGIDGFEMVFASPSEVVMHLLSLALGLGVVMAAVRLGRRAQNQAQAEAEALAQANVAALTGTDSSPPAQP